MKYSTLVSTEQLAQHLDDPDWIVIDCRYTLTNPNAGLQSYAIAHIPGARYAHLDNDLSSSITLLTGRHPLPDAEALADKLGKWGVDGSKQVVVYDDSFGAMASRLWWLLRWLGHDAVALLDGGIQRWQKREKRPVTADFPVVQATRFIAKPRREMWVSSLEVDQALRQGNTLLIDARSEERFNGEIEPLDKVAGHIPGAVNLPFEDNLDLGGTFLSADELRAFYLDTIHGVSADQVVHMCGSGVTACHNVLAMERAGMSGTKLYVGSWSEWITDPKRPVVTGED
jgi:thiosulfate/3-mercaptopyruvate sulfurtransferase